MNIYITDTSPLVCGDVFNNYYSKISEYRRMKVDRCRNESARRLSLGAGILLEKAMTDIDRQDLLGRIVATENGRPVFDGISDCFFNLSHSGERAMCVVSECPVGCDVQIMKDDGIRIAKRFFTEDEQKYVFADDRSELTADRFYQIWTRKEAFTKISGDGITRDFRSFSVLNTGYFFWEDQLDGYRFAAASESDHSVDKVEIVKL